MQKAAFADVYSQRPLQFFGGSEAIKIFYIPFFALKTGIITKVINFCGRICDRIQETVSERTGKALDEFKKYKNAAAVFLSGEIDHCSAQALKGKIDVFIESSGRKNFIIDLGGVQMMDSSGIALIIGRMKAVRALGGDIAISGAAGGVKRVIELSGILQTIKMYASAAEAAKSFE